MRTYSLIGAALAGSLVASGLLQREDVLGVDDEPQRPRPLKPKPEAAQPTAHDLERIRRAESKRARKAGRAALEAPDHG